MAVLLVTYDLRAPGKDYRPVHEYLRKYTYCKDMESVWLLDSNQAASKVRDELSQLVDSNDRVFVVRITQDWASWNFACSKWLNDASRNW